MAIIRRHLDIDEAVNTTFIYGSGPWIEEAVGESLGDSSTPNRAINVIQSSGHRV